MLLSQSSSQPGQFAAMRSDVREHHGGGRQGELHDRRGGLHGRRKDHRQRPDPLQVCFARISMQSHTLSYHLKKKKHLPLLQILNIAAQLHHTISQMIRFRPQMTFHSVRCRVYPCSGGTGPALHLKRVSL